MPPHSALAAIVTVLLHLIIFRAAASDHSTLSKRTPKAIDPSHTAPVTTASKAFAAHCGDEWNSYALKQPGFSSCMDYAGKSLACNVSTCHMGLQSDTPKTSPLLPKLYMVNCTQVGAAAKSTPSVVYATSYQARNLDGVVTVKGFALGDPKEKINSYRCLWRDRTDWNNQRVWCGECHAYQVNRP